MMDFSVLLANLRAVAEKYKGQTTDPQTASAAYVDMFVQMLMKADKMTDKYEDHITIMWVAVNQLAAIYKDLSPGSSRDRLSQYIFGMCGRVVLNVQWAQLDEDEKVKKDFVSTVQTTHDHLKSLGYEKFELILNLMESQWTDPILSEIMTSEEEEIEGGLDYIIKEDPEILKLRIEIMMKENCEEFALNLCEWSLKHPKLTGDLKIREYQIVILYKQQEYKKMQDVCSQVLCHDGILLMSRLAKSSTNQDLCIRLAQVFLIQDWVNPDRNCCTQELLKLWIHHQYLADKDEERFLDSIWTVAKVCRSTEQIWVLIEGVRRECGDMFIQLYTELCKYALNIDKGNMEQEESKGNKEEVERRKKLIARTCVRMAFMLKDYDFRMSRICGLTAFSLLPTTDNLNLVNKLYWTIKNTSVISGNSKINPATIYEVERLLGLMRPETLNPDFSWKQIIPVCKRYQVTKGNSAEGNESKIPPKKPHDKPNILSSVKQNKTLKSAIPQTLNQLPKTQTSESPKSIQRTHAEHLLAQNRSLSTEKVSQLAKEKFPKKVGDLADGPPLNAKELGKTINDLKKSIGLNNRYSYDLTKKLSPLSSQNSVDYSSRSGSQSSNEHQMSNHMGSSSATHSKSPQLGQYMDSYKLLEKRKQTTSKDSKNSAQSKSSFNVLRPPGTANQECAKIAQQIAEMHEKQRREKALIQGRQDGLKFALNSRNIPSSSQISDLLSLSIKEKLGDSTQKVNSDKLDVIRKGSGLDLKQNQSNVKVHTPVSSSNQTISTQNRHLNTQKYYVATEEVMRNYRHDQSGNITVGESKVPIKPVFSMAVRKSFNSQQNQEELKQTISNLVKRTQDVPLNLGIPSTGNISVLGQNDQVKSGDCFAGYQNSPTMMNSASASSNTMKTSVCNIQPRPQHIPSVAVTPTNQGAVSHVPIIQTSRDTINPDIIMAVVSDVNFQNYNTLSQDTLPILSAQSVSQSLNFEQHHSNFNQQYQQYVHNPVEITKVNQQLLTQQPFVTVQQVNNHISQPVYETKTQLVRGQQFLQTPSSVVQQHNPCGNIQIQTIPITPSNSQTFLHVQSSPNTSIPQQALNLSGQNLSASNNSTQKSANMNAGIRNIVDRQGSSQDIQSASGFNSASKQFITPPELSPAVFRQILSSFAQGSSSKGKQSEKQTKGQNQQIKKEMIQQNLTREVIRHLTLNKNDETVKKSVIEATQKILQLRKQYDNVNQSMPGQRVQQNTTGNVGMTGGINQLNNSVSSESIPELPDLGSELDSILSLDDNNQVNGRSSITPENSSKESNNSIIKVQSDAEMIQQLEKILDTSAKLTSNVTTKKNSDRKDDIPVSNNIDRNSKQKQIHPTLNDADSKSQQKTTNSISSDASIKSQQKQINFPSKQENKKSEHKQTNSTYLNANRLAKEKEMKQSKDGYSASPNGRVMCKNCEHYFRDPGQLSQHLNLNLCKEFNIYRGKEDTTNKKTKMIDSSDQEKLICSMCNSNFKTIDDLRTHIKQTCPGSLKTFALSKEFDYSFVYKCTSCNWMNANEKIAWKHAENCTSNVSGSPLKNPAKLSLLYKCAMCSDLFSDKETTYNHVRKLCSHLSHVKEHTASSQVSNILSNNETLVECNSEKTQGLNEDESEDPKSKCDFKNVKESVNRGNKEFVKYEPNIDPAIQQFYDIISPGEIKTEYKASNEQKIVDLNTETKSVSETQRISSTEGVDLAQHKIRDALCSKIESSPKEVQSQEGRIEYVHKTESKEAIKNMQMSTEEQMVEEDKSTNDQEEIIKYQKLKRISENYYLEQFTEIELKRKALRKMKNDQEKLDNNSVNENSIKETLKQLSKALEKEESVSKSDQKDRKEQSFSKNRMSNLSKKRKAEDNDSNSSLDMRNRINNFKRRRRGEVIDTRRDRGLRAKQLIKKKKYLIDEMEPIAPEAKKVNEKKGEEEPSKKQSKKTVPSDPSDQVKACKLCSFKQKNYFLAQHYTEKHNVGFKQSGQLVYCRFCRFKSVKEDLIKLKKHVTACHWQELLSQFGEDEMEHSFNGKIKSGLRKSSPSKSKFEGHGPSVSASPRKSEKLKKHLKALALRKKCAENLRKIAKKQSVGSGIELNGSKTSDSEAVEMDCSPAKNELNEKDVQQSHDRMIVRRRSNKNESEVHNTEISARISGRTRSRSSSQSSRSSLGTQALKNANDQSRSGTLPSSRTVTDSSNVTESSALEDDGLSDENHSRSREKRRISRRNARCSDRKKSTDEHFSSDSSNDRSFSRFTRSSNSQSSQQRKTARDKASKNGESSNSGKLQTKSGTRRPIDSGALSDDDEVTSSTDVSEKFFIATKIEDFQDDSFQTGPGLGTMDLMTSKYSSDEEYELERNQRQYSLRKRKQKSDYRELEFSDPDHSTKTSDSERSRIKREGTESGDDYESSKSWENSTVKRIKQKLIQKNAEEPQEQENLTIKRYRELQQKLREEFKQEPEECEDLTDRNVEEMNQKSKSILLGPDDEFKDLKYPPQKTDTTDLSSLNEESNDQSIQSPQMVQQMNTTVMEFDDEFAFLQQMEQKTESTCKDNSNKDHAKMEAFNSEFQKFTSQTLVASDHDSSDSDIDHSDVKKQSVTNQSTTKKDLNSEKTEDTQIFDVPVLPPRNNFVDAFHKFAKNENKTKEKACVKEKPLEVKSRNFIGAFESFNEEKSVSVCLTRLEPKPRVKPKRVDWKQKFGIVNCSVRLEKLQTRTIEKYKRNVNKETPKQHDCIIIIDSESSSDADFSISTDSSQKEVTSKQESMSNVDNSCEEITVPQSRVSEILHKVNLSFPADKCNDTNKNLVTEKGDFGDDLYNNTTENDPDFVWVENAESFAEQRETVQVDISGDSVSDGKTTNQNLENDNIKQEQEIVILTETGDDDVIQNENVVEFCMTEEIDNCVENMITFVEDGDQDIKSIEPGSSNIIFIVKDNEELITDGISMEITDETSFVKNMPISNSEAEVKICEDQSITSERFELDMKKETSQNLKPEVKNEGIKAKTSDENLICLQEKEKLEEYQCEQSANKGNDLVSFNETEEGICEGKDAPLNKVKYETDFNSVRECLEAIIHEIELCQDIEEIENIPLETVDIVDPSSVVSLSHNICTNDIVNLDDEIIPSKVKTSFCQTIDLTEIPEDKYSEISTESDILKTLDHIPNKSKVDCEKSNKYCEFEFDSKKRELEYSGDKSVRIKCETDNGSCINQLAKSKNYCDSEENRSVVMVDIKDKCHIEDTESENPSLGNNEPNELLMDTQSNITGAFKIEKCEEKEYCSMKNHDSDEKSSHILSENAQDIGNMLPVVSLNSIQTRCDNLDSEMNDRTLLNMKHISSKSCNEDSNTAALWEPKDLEGHENSLLVITSNKTNKSKLTVSEEISMEHQKGVCETDDVIQVMVSHEQGSKAVKSETDFLSDKISQETAFQSDKGLLETTKSMERNPTDKITSPVVNPDNFDGRPDDAVTQTVTDSDLESVKDVLTYSNETFEVPCSENVNDQHSPQNEVKEDISSVLKGQKAVTNKPNESASNIVEMDVTSKEETEIFNFGSNKIEQHNSSNPIRICFTGEHLNSDEFDGVESLDNKNHHVDPDPESFVEVSGNHQDLMQHKVTVNEIYGSDVCTRFTLDPKAIQINAYHPDLKNEKENTFDQSELPVSSEQVLDEYSETSLPASVTENVQETSDISNILDRESSSFSSSRFTQISEKLTTGAVMSCKAKKTCEVKPTKTFVHEQLESSDEQMNSTVSSYVSEELVSAEFGEGIPTEESEVILKVKEDDLTKEGIKVNVMEQRETAEVNVSLNLEDQQEIRLSDKDDKAKDGVDISETDVSFANMTESAKFDQINNSQEPHDCLLSDSECISDKHSHQKKVEQGLSSEIKKNILFSNDQCEISSKISEMSDTRNGEKISNLLSNKSEEHNSCNQIENTLTGKHLITDAEDNVEFLEEEHQDAGITLESVDKASEKDNQIQDKVTDDQVPVSDDCDSLTSKVSLDHLENMKTSEVESVQTKADHSDLENSMETTFDQSGSQASFKQVLGSCQERYLSTDNLSNMKSNITQETPSFSNVLDEEPYSSSPARPTETQESHPEEIAHEVIMVKESYMPEEIREDKHSDSSTLADEQLNSTNFPCNTPEDKVLVEPKEEITNEQSKVILTDETGLEGDIETSEGMTVNTNENEESVKENISSSNLKNLEVTNMSNKDDSVKHEDVNCVTVSNIHFNIHSDDVLCNLKSLQENQHEESDTDSNSKVLHETNEVCVEDVARVLLEVLLEKVTSIDKGTTCGGNGNVLDHQKTNSNVSSNEIRQCDESEDKLSKCIEFEKDKSKETIKKSDIIDETKEPVDISHSQSFHNTGLNNDTVPTAEHSPTKVDSMLVDEIIETIKNKADLPSLKNHTNPDIYNDYDKDNVFSQCPDISQISFQPTVEEKANTVNTNNKANEGKRCHRNTDSITGKQNRKIKVRNVVKVEAKNSQSVKEKNETPNRKLKSLISKSNSKSSPSNSLGKESKISTQQKVKTHAVEEQKAVQSKRQAVQGKKEVTDKRKGGLSQQEPVVKSETEKDKKLEEVKVEEEEIDEEEQFKRRMESVKKARRKSTTAPYESDFNFECSRNEVDPQLKNKSDNSANPQNCYTECGSPASSLSSEQESPDVKGLKEEEVKSQMTTRSRLTKVPVSVKDSPVKAGGVEQFLRRMESVKKARRKTATASYQSDFNFDCENSKIDNETQVSETPTKENVIEETKKVISQIKTRSRQSKSLPSVPVESAVKSDIKTYTKESKVAIFSPHIFTLDSVKKLRDQSSKKHTSSVPSKQPPSKVSYIDELKQTQAELGSLNSSKKSNNCNSAKGKCEECIQFTQLKSPKTKSLSIESLNFEPSASKNSERMTPQISTKSPIVHKKDKPKRSHNDSGIESDKDESLSVTKQSEIKTRNRDAAASKCVKDIRDNKTKDKLCSNKQVEDSIEKKQCSNKRKRSNAKVNEKSDSEPSSKSFKLDGTSKSPVKKSPEQCKDGKCDSKCEKCIEIRRSRTTSPKPRNESKKSVRQIFHGGKIFEIKKGSLTEMEFKRRDPKKDVTLSTPSTSNNERPERSRLKRDSKHLIHTRQSETTELNETVIGERTNLNEYIHKTLEQIKKERRNISHKTSNWTVKKERCVKSYKFPYAFKKSPRR